MFTSKRESRSQRFTLALTTALFLLLAGCSSAPPDSIAELDTFPFTTLDGESGTLAAYEGEPIVVNFFASWCPPCRAEMPAFEEVHNSSDVTILGVSHDFDETSWRSFVGETGITFETVFQPDQEIYEALGAVAMPTTVLITADGTIASTHTGQLTAEELQAGIDEHLS